MRKNRKVLSLIAVILALVMVIGVIASLVYYAVSTKAASISEMQSQKAQIEQQLGDLKSKQSGILAKQEELKGQIAELESESAAYTEQKKALDEKIELRLQEIANIDEQLNTYIQLIEEKEVELAEAIEEQEYQLERYKTRVRAMEEDGNLSYFSVLFSAKNFSDLLNKIYDIQEIVEYDQMVSEQLDAATQAVEKAKAGLEETKAELEVMKAEAESAKAQLELEVADAQAMIDKLNANIAESEGTIAELDNDRARVDSEINSAIQDVSALNSNIQKAIAEEESKAVAAAARAAAARQAAESATSGASSSVQYSGGGKTATGDFIWPTTSTKITSPYGYRIHPISGGSKLHAGVDIGAPTGTSIFAAASGQVVTAKYSSSYGYYILINHGNGVYTLYAHCSALYVSAGDAVAQGNSIAAVGSTGNSTGPHLHFEVKINGSTVNPLNYFS